MPTNTPIGESSSLNISLPMLIQAVGFIAAMVWGYGQLNTRISFLEHQAQGNETAIEEMIPSIDSMLPPTPKKYFFKCDELQKGVST